MTQLSATIQRIKKEFSILEFIQNPKPTKPEGWYIARCPFHQQDDDPRCKRKFWIDNRPGRGMCGCFVPRCAEQQPNRKPMDVINFYARLHNLTNRQAIIELAGKLK